MYYLRFADLLTDVDLCELTCPFKADRRIIQPGAFSFDMEISNADIGAKVAMIIPQKTICHVYRGSLIIGSYIIWSRKYSGSNSRVTVSIQGSGIESYLYRRQLNSDLTYAGIDQIQIACDLISAAQLGVGGSYTSNGALNISASPFSSGILRDRTYLVSSGKFLGDLLEELANCDAGFEYTIDTIQSEDGLDRYRIFSMAYDRFSEGTQPFVVEEPGSIESWSILYDGVKGSTVFWTRGQSSAETVGTESGPTISDPAFAPGFLDSGYPILENVTDYQNVSDVDTLNKYAAWWATNRSGPVMIPTFTVNAEHMFNHGFTPMSLGSELYAILSNPIFPTLFGVPSFTTTIRIIGFEISVDLNGVESMDVIGETDFDPTEVV